MISENEMNEIKQRLINPSKLKKGMDYDNHVSLLICSVEEVQDIRRLSLLEQKELKELREMKQKIINDVYNWGIQFGVYA